MYTYSIKLCPFPVFTESDGQQNTSSDGAGLSPDGTAPSLDTTEGGAPSSEKTNGTAPAPDKAEPTTDPSSGAIEALAASGQAISRPEESGRWKFTFKFHV